MLNPGAGIELHLRERLPGYDSISVLFAATEVTMLTTR